MQIRVWWFGISSCSGISCICSRHSWWQDRVCLPYFYRHLTLMSQVLCHVFCAVALSLAVKQPYDMVAAFLLQNHLPAPPSSEQGSVTTRLEQHREKCSPLHQLAQHNDQYLLDGCSALLCVLKVSLPIMESSVGAVLWSYCISRNWILKRLDGYITIIETKGILG